MAEGAFHRGDRDRCRALPVDETNGRRFGEVARGRRSRVGVDVIDLLGSDLRRRRARRAWRGRRLCRPAVARLDDRRRSTCRSRGPRRRCARRDSAHARDPPERASRRPHQARIRPVRHRRAGWQRLDRRCYRSPDARMTAKPAAYIGCLVDSVAPPIMIGALPSRTSSNASPIACAPVAQAVVSVRLGPLMPNRD